MPRVPPGKGRIWLLVGIVLLARAGDWMPWLRWTVLSVGVVGTVSLLLPGVGED